MDKIVLDKLEKLQSKSMFELVQNIIVTSKLLNYVCTSYIDEHSSKIHSYELYFDKLGVPSFSLMFEFTVENQFKLMVLNINHTLGFANFDLFLKEIDNCNDEENKIIYSFAQTTDGEFKVSIPHHKNTLIEQTLLSLNKTL